MRHWNQQACVAVRRDCVQQLHNYNSNTDLRKLAVAAEFPCLRGIPWNSAETRKFRGNGQIPWLGSKFRGSRKTVGPTDQRLKILASFSAPSCLSILWKWEREDCSASHSKITYHSGVNSFPAIVCTAPDKLCFSHIYHYHNYNM